MSTNVHDIFDVTALSEGQKLLSEEEIVLTVEAADEFLELDEFTGDRNLTDSWVHHLAEEMERGTFLFPLVILIVAIHDGVRYRLNGQHTCWARKEHEDDDSYSQPVKLLTFQAEDYEALRNLYVAIDQGKTRTPSQQITALLSNWNGYQPIAKRPLQYVAKGFKFWYWAEPGKRKNYDAQTVAYLLKTDYLDLGIRVGTFLTEHQSTAKHIMKTAVAAAIFGSMKKSVTKAIEFWTVVATGIGADRAGDPRIKLRDFLLTNSTRSSDNSSKKNVSSEEMIRTCIVAWNAWRQPEGKRTRKQLKVNMKAKRPAFK